MKSIVLESIEDHARCGSKKLALAGNGISFDYQALLAEIDKIAGQLTSLFPGNRPIAVCLENSPAWVLIDLALLKLGRISTPLPSFFTEAQRDHALAHCGAEYIICDTDIEQQEFVVAGKTLYFRNSAAEPVTLPHGTAKITFTSGTTGKPKGVCLSLSQMEQVSVSLVEAIGKENSGIHCAVLPLSILLENAGGLYSTLIAGGCYCVPAPESIGLGNPFAPDFAGLLSALVKIEATSAILVPELLNGLLHAIEIGKKPLPALRFVAVGGAKISSALLEQAASLNLPVYQGYGLSEAASVVAVNSPGANRQGSVGKVLPHLGVSFGIDGEIFIHSQLLLGYVAGPSFPAPLATGDIGHMDKDGFLFIDGRKSNVLITSFGRNVSPEWIESELLDNAEFAQAIVFGDAAPSLSALIVPSSSRVTDREIDLAISRTNSTLPAYAQVRQWAKARPFTPHNGLLTMNGRLQRAAIGKEYYEVMSSISAKPVKSKRFFERLTSETATERNYLLATKQIQDGLQGRISRETYLDYLAEAYYHVSNTVPLLTLARNSLPPKDSWLAPEFDEYITEESGHEEWILDDIRNAGGDAEKVRHGQPRVETELMVAYAYDFVSRVNPVGLLGMVLVLEGTSTQLATRGAEALMKSLKLPDDCFHYLMSHGSLDLEHMKFFETLMDRMDDPENQAAIIHMAKRIYILFGNLFRAIPHGGDLKNVA